MNTGFDQYHTGTRRRSFSGGFPAGGGFPPAHSDGGYHRDGFSNDPYNSSYQELRGPPSYPPPGMSQGWAPPSNMPFPNDLSPPPLTSQPFQSGGPGSFPSPGGMPASYSMGGTRERYPSSPYDTGMNSTGLPPPGPSAAYNNSFPLSNNQYPLDDGGFNPRGRTYSTGGGFGPPALVPVTPPMTPSHSHYSAKRSRRASSAGPGGVGFTAVGDPYHGYSGRHPSGHSAIKFRLTRSTHSGISVREALDRVPLSQGNAYLMRDVSMDMSGKISLKVRVRFISSPSSHRLCRSV
jgi:hypothetical protein